MNARPAEAAVTAAPHETLPDAAPDPWTPPRLGFLGVGWIGGRRMEAVVGAGAARAVALADPTPEGRRRGLEVAPDARALSSLDQLLAMELDGVVIATPSAAHAEQAQACLEAGLAVFCQKPLGRTEQETSDIVRAARDNDRLLGVDFCYRHTRALERVRTLVRSGTLGRIHAVDLLFHNAYGPDKPWFYRRSDAGGGCLMDLGIHLVDLLFWCLGETEARVTGARLHAGGRPLGSAAAGGEAVENWADLTLELPSGLAARLACSWNLPAGRDAVIEARFYGTEGGCAFRNVGGSFYDFVAERYDGTRTERLAEPPDDWGGRAVVAWARALGGGAGFDPGVETAVHVARVLDQAYGR